jgi:hypothetical protein
MDGRGVRRRPHSGALAIGVIANLELFVLFLRGRRRKKVLKCRGSYGEMN